MNPVEARSMSRLAAYLGPSTPAAHVLEAGTYSLVSQARDFPDGFGIGWYPQDGRPEPVRFAVERPAWRAGADLEIPRRYPSRCAVAAVRRARQTPAGRSGIQPLTGGPFLFAYDGILEAFDTVFVRPLRERLGDARYRALRGSSAAELLFATWLDALDDSRGPEAAATALESMVSTVHDLAHASAVAASLAIVIADGENLVTLRTATGGPAPELYTIVAADDAPVPRTGRIITSSPLFAGQWTSLERHSLVIFSGER